MKLFPIVVAACIGLLVGSILTNIADTSPLRTKYAALEAKYNRGEWDGAINLMPYMWKQIDEHRLAKLDLGYWPMYVDIDNTELIFNPDGVPFEYHDRKTTFGAINGGINVFTREKHYNPRVEINIGKMLSGDGSFHVEIPATTSNPDGSPDGKSDR